MSLKVHSGAESLDDLIEEGKRLLAESRELKLKWMERLGVDREKHLYNHPTAREELEEINRKMAQLQRRIEALKQAGRS